ncbi:polyprenyl synthetase family protein [Furfurilactobacillus curtus]|uniref:Farnesyl-diphosphate synthase n=1 Tax=Furfurilactobacillus curtus TaxID=1746200 RepID=A0ABQ5JKG8_9LACO
MSKVLTAFEATYLPQINDCLAKQMAHSSTQATLQAAMTYSVMAGGKRLRPLLTIAALTGLKGELTGEELAAACAVELIHTYSLIHDDLPAMDNDDLRRGQATNHKVYGEDVAILAGDGLQTLAFDWLSSLSLPLTVKVTLISELAHAAGPVGMVAGQTLDVTLAGTTISLAKLRQLHREKTGALLVYTMRAGAFMGQASETQLKLLTQFGQAFGLAFQIYDDILDETQTAAALGKTPNKDVAEGKNTYPKLLGLPGAKQALIEQVTLSRQLCRQLATTGMNVDRLGALLDYFIIDGKETN